MLRLMLIPALVVAVAVQPWLVAAGLAVAALTGFTLRFFR